MSGGAARPAAISGGHPILRAIGIISLVCGWAAAAMIVMAVLLTCEMIFVRYVLGVSTSWQTDTVIFLAVGATLIGLPYVQRLRGHVNVDLVPLMLPYGVRRVLAVVTLLAAIAVVAVCAWYGYEYWHLAWSRGWTTETVDRIPLWIPYLALPIGFSAYLLQLVADLIAVVIGDDHPFGLAPNATIATAAEGFTDAAASEETR